MAQLITVTQLAEQLALAPQTIFNRISQGTNLPQVIRIGRCVRFDQFTVDAWVNQQTAHVNGTGAAIPLQSPIVKRKRGRPTKAEQIAARQVANNG